MAGHMGATRVTTQNLEIVSTDTETAGSILIRGCRSLRQGLLDHGGVTPSSSRCPTMRPKPAGHPRVGRPSNEAPAAEEAPASEGAE